MGAYSWEVLTRNEFENLFEMKRPEKVATRFLSDHWLTEGEIWTMLNLDRYGTLARSSKSVPSQQSVVRTAGNTNALFA